MFKVIDRQGDVHGPVSIDELKVWVSEGRLTRDMNVIDPISGTTQKAEVALSDYDVFPSTIPPAPGSVAALFEPSPVSATDAELITRFFALLIDVLISIPLVLLAFVPVLGLLIAPILTLYYLCRDNLAGPGLSLGKKMLGIKVISLDGAPMTYGKSALRNIVYLGYVFMAIPIVGNFLTMLFVSPLGLLDVILVLITKRRLGDNFAKTKVVKSSP